MREEKKATYMYTDRRKKNHADLYRRTAHIPTEHTHDTEHRHTHTHTHIHTLARARARIRANVGRGYTDTPMRTQ